MNKLKLTKMLAELRQKVKGVLWGDDPELYKDIESVKAQIRNLHKEKDQ